MTTDLKGQHALVTGGGKGIGLAIASALSKTGARVSIVGRDAAALERAVAAGAAHHFAVVDIRDETASLAVIKKLGEEHYFDIAVANAGGVNTAPFQKCDAAFFNAMLTLNLISTVTTFRAVLPGMTKRRQGRLIAVASTAGHRGYPYVSAYCAAKHAVLGLVKSLARETAKSGVTVNAICPGYTDTDLVAASVQRISDRTAISVDDAMAHLVADNPMGRLIKPEEVAAAALYLCGTASGATTGQSIIVNGGEF
jgi:3-hydroxybutyrate dehydrogenase